MRYAILTAALLSALGAVDCGEGYVATSDELCFGIECSGHGECAVVDVGREVTCICDPGYFSYGLECVPDHSPDGDGDGDSDVDGDTDADVDSDSDADADADVDGDTDADADGDADADSDGGCVPDCAGRTCGLDPRCGQSCGVCDGACCDGVCHGGGDCCSDEDCGPCTGTAMPCLATTESSSCSRRLGCVWQPAGCIGTPVACEHLTYADHCGLQEGCAWSECSELYVCT